MSLVSTVRYVMPYGLVQQFFRSKAVIRRRLADRNAAYAAHLSYHPPYSYQAAIEFHRARGMTNGHLVAGSMPESALEFCCNTVDRLAPNGPLVGLHVGNFLGVSLSHFVNYVRQRDETSNRGKIFNIAAEKYEVGLIEPGEIISVTDADVAQQLG